MWAEGEKTCRRKIPEMALSLRKEFRSRGEGGMEEKFEKKTWHSICYLGKL